MHIASGTTPADYPLTIHASWNSANLCTEDPTQTATTLTVEPPCTGTWWSWQCQASGSFQRGTTSTTGRQWQFGYQTGGQSRGQASGQSSWSSDR